MPDVSLPTRHPHVLAGATSVDASVVVPVDFFRLPLIAVIGIAFYGEAFDPFVMLGAAMMFAGIYYSIARKPAPAGAVP